MTLGLVADVFGLVFLLVALPVVSLRQLKLIRGMEIQRVGMYASSALTLLVLGGLSLGLGLFRGGWAAVGLVPPHDFLRWTALLTGGGLTVMFAFRGLSAVLGLHESALLLKLLPSTPRERAAFAVLSVAAGVGEEVAYRGYAVTTLAAFAGGPVAVVLTSLAFGVMHAYQGALGVVRTFLLGAWLGWGFLACGSLWPPMAAHALLDVLAGIVLARWLTGPGPAQGDPAGVREVGAPDEAP